MNHDTAVFVPARPYDETDEKSIFAAFEPGTRVLPAGFQTLPHFAPLGEDIVFDKDVAVTLRDGVTIYVDVYRPPGTERVPVIVAWSPYGKSQGTDPKQTDLFGLLGMDTTGLSGLQKFEAPDPAYWCANGYAICNPDARGVFDSEGDSVMFGKQEGEDCHDLIEWLAEQDWCTGKVGMSGTSYLAISQWFTAAERPPHLAAISPTEGMSDIYRDLTVRGGMLDATFSEFLAAGNYKGNGRCEDLVAEAEKYPLFNDLWASKAARLQDITVPAYIVASYSNSIHTPGTFRGWRQIASTDKWLRVHNTMEWPDFYDEARTLELHRFFDHYLKDDDNGWDQTPRVRYSVLDLEGGDLVDQAAEQFPPTDFVTTRFHLDAAVRALTGVTPAEDASVSYDAESQDSVSFTLGFDRETQLVGYPKAHLWVEADGHDDMDLFVLLQKLGADGERLEQFNVPNHGPVMQTLTENGSSILKYKGSDGRLRVSLRRLDELASTDDVPVHSFDRTEKLTPGEIVAVDIDLFPVGLAFHPGESLRVTISGFNSLGGVMPRQGTLTPDNRGRHVIHTGGSHDSYLQVPAKVIATA